MEETTLIMDDEYNEQDNLFINEGSIIDADYILKIDESYETQQVTDIFNGELLALIISTSNKVSIDISFYELPEVKLYSDLDYQGIHYIPIVMPSYGISNPKMTIRDRPHRNVFLNNRLLIKITGSMGTETQVTVRYRK